MTSRFPVASDLHNPAATPESSAARIVDEGPYARPTLLPHRAVDAVLIDAIRASVGPFVPAAWRTVSAASTPISVAFTGTLQAPADHQAAPEVQEADEVQPAGDDDALPWIESFMDATETAAAVVEQPSEVEAADVVGARAAEDSIAPSSDAIAAEEWPLEDAGEAIRSIADDLARHADASSSTPVDAKQASPDVPAQPLRMWSEDDMDIMPVKVTPPEVESAEQWAARARRESEEGSPESAALALEGLASRIRSGEIQLPTFSAGMGEAAALAAALAALLNLRR